MRAVTLPRHLIAGASVLVASGLAVTGVAGEPLAVERFDAKQVVVAPADPGDPDDDALRVTEVIDQDFGDQSGRGHERFIPVDFGVPVDVTASSDTAPDDVSVVRTSPDEVRIRIGDPEVTITGQHRYVMGFTLPEARLGTGQLALDVIGTEEEVETGRFEVVVTGFELEDPLCNVGSFGASGGCELVRDGEVYRAVIEPLPAGEGITIGGTIVGRIAVVDVAPPPLPEPVEEADQRLLLGLLGIPLGGAAVAGLYRVFARLGRNQVHGAGGAADAAFGDLPPPPGAAAPPDPAQDPRSASGTTYLTDRQLAELATIEFVPPPGLEPWHGAVLLSESIDDDSVGAWFSGLAGAEAIELEAEGTSSLVVTPGPRYDEVDTDTKLLLVQMFGGKDRLELGGYDSDFAKVWGTVRARQVREVGAAGWWTRFGPGNTGVRNRAIAGLIALAGLVGAVGLIVAAFSGFVPNLVTGIAFVILLPLLVSIAMYARLLPARSASGSALTLRTASFRRFLDASEGQHVDWAWERGVVREYSAWAVALGAADAWSKAMERSSVVPNDPSLRSPLLLATMAAAVSSSHVQRSSSSGSGGFSGGSVGGGGGGGRSGSW